MCPYKTFGPNHSPESCNELSGPPGPLVSFVNNPPGHPVCVIKFNGLSLQYVVPHIKHISYIYLTVAQKPCMHTFHLKERWTSMLMK